MAAGARGATVRKAEGVREAPRDGATKRAGRIARDPQAAELRGVERRRGA
jgi:hypothetical protein